MGKNMRPMDFILERPGQVIEGEIGTVRGGGVRSS